MEGIRRSRSGITDAVLSAVLADRMEQLDELLVAVCPLKISLPAHPCAGPDLEHQPVSACG